MTSRAGSGVFTDWAELRDHAITAFNGETPHPIAEQAIIDTYEQHPQAVELAVSGTITDFRAGTIRSGWGILRKRCETINAPPTNPTRNTSISREKRIMRAEQWIRTAGIHYDRADELLLELFGSENALLRPDAQIDLEPDTGPTDARWRLSDPRGDTQLVDRIVRTWEEHRPTGEKLEADAEHRAAQWKARERALAQLRAPTPDDDLPL
jgi:hypothetical protein